MTTIQRSADCGNSPKNKAVEDIAIGFETGSLDLEKLTEALVWRDWDGETATSRNEAGTKLSSRPAPQRVQVESVTSHGKIGAAAGTTIRGERTERFSHIIRFSSAAAKQACEIESFRKLEVQNG